MPSLGIVITTYNSERYINRLLDTVRFQKESFDEVIIVDHSSTDRTVDFVKAYKSNFNLNFKFIKMIKNFGGPSWPRNKAIQVAESDYLCFSDADDLITNNRALIIKEKLNEKSYDLILHQAISFYDDINNPEKINLISPMNNVRSTKNLLNTLYYDDKLTPTGVIVVRTSLLKSILFREDENIIGGEDKCLLMDIALKEVNIGFINEILLLYYLGSKDLEKNEIYRNSLSSSKRTLAIVNYIHENYSKYFNSEYSPRLLFSSLYILIKLKNISQSFSFIKEYGLKLFLLSILEGIMTLFKRIYLATIGILNKKKFKRFFLRLIPHEFELI